MIYLIKSYLPFGKYIYKVGFTNNILKRYYQYFYSNPGSEIVSTREGDEFLEKLLHYYLYYRGFKYMKNGKLSEWFLGDEEVRNIFHYSRETIESALWKHREEVLNPEKESSFDYKIFEYLYQKNKENFSGEEFVIEGKKVIRKAKKSVDIIFWKIYSPENFITPPPNINLDPTLEKELDDFLDNHFYKTNLFHEKMKMYCEFMDQHKNNPEIEEIIFHKISDDRFRKYYNFYGTSGCSARKYREGELYNGMHDKSKEDILKTAILNTFKVGERYTLKDIKSMLSTIYKENNVVSKNPKATDLGDYFKLTVVNFYDPETKKRTAGFRLDPL